MSPTGRAAAALGVLAGLALLVPASVVVLLALALTAMAVVDATFAARPIAIDRRVGRIAARGVPSQLTVAVAAHPSTRCAVRQATPPGLAVDPDTAPGGLEAALVAGRRGRHTLPAVAVRATGPLGLARWDHTDGIEADVVVYPDLPAARRLARAVREGRFSVEGRRPRGALGLGTEFEYVRDYAPDDDIRQVNWRATERVGRPMSNQYRLDQERDVILLVDSGRLMTAPLGDRTRLDTAVDAAVAVAAVADVLGDRCGVVAFAGQVRRHLRPARAGSGRVVEALHDLEPVGEDSDYELSFRIAGAAKRALVLVLTDILDEAAARSLAGALPILGRRHAVVVASATDPDVAAAADAEPTTTDAAYVRAVAHELLAARGAVIASLARAGVATVEARPDQLSAACVGAYLRLKARARL